MSKEQEYREHAAQMVGLAQRARSTSDKARLLKIAEAWLDLADKIRRVGARFRAQPSERSGSSESLRE